MASYTPVVRPWYALDMLDAKGSLAIVGCGTMGDAITSGLLRTDWCQPHQIAATTRTPANAKRLHEKHGIETSTNNVQVCKSAQVVLVCLKPQRIPVFLADPEIVEALKSKTVISIAAGLSLEQLTALLPDSQVIRAMPNTPCRVGQGLTVMSRCASTSDESMRVATQIFESVGACIEVESQHMNAVTSLNGSGPAFVYVMLEAMADGGVMMGLPRETALTIAAHVFAGSARMTLETDLHPAALRDQVTTPAGCTIAGLLTMEDGRIRSVLARTIQKATEVAGNLGKEPQTK